MGFESIDQSGLNQKLIVIQKWAFHFFGWRGVADGVLVHWPARLIIRSWTKSINEHFMFLAGEAWWMGFMSIYQPGWSSEVEHNPKMRISFFGLKRGGRWGLSPSTSPANHQKLSVIQKQAFHFIGWRWVVDGVWVHWPVWPKSEVDFNTKMSISLFLAGEGWQMGFESIDQPGWSSEV